MTEKYDKNALAIVFVGFAIFLMFYSLLIAAEIVEPLDNIGVSSILLSLAAYNLLDYYTKIRKIKSRDKDETENED